MNLLPRTRALAVAGALAATATLSGATVATGATAVAAADCGTSTGAGAAARSSEGHFGEGGEDVLSRSRAKAMDKAVARAARASKGDKQTVTTINVRAHIIKGVGTGGGGASRTAVAASIKQLNKAYGGTEGAGGANTGFQFKLTTTSVTTNDNWYRKINPNNPSNDKYTKQMKQALHVGQAKALNLYFVKFSGGLLGFATFPDDYASAKKLDGVVVDFRTAPRGTATNYNQGDTATHEVGHWLGLRHVFFDYSNQSCSNSADDNDSITDTPIQATPSAGCPVGKDSCSGGGVDNINNYMDYSYDSCMYLFTPGQASYMANAFNAYRLNG